MTSARPLSLLCQTSAYMRLNYGFSCKLRDYYRYYALSAASALFKHAELRLNVRFAASSLLIRYTQVEGTMMIDSDTARNLELVGNMSVRKSAHSLFGYVCVFL